MAESSVYLFNPTAEMAIANGTISYQAPKLLQEFETALSSVSGFFAQKSDVLLVRESIPNQFTDLWSTYGFTFPETCALAELPKLTTSLHPNVELPEYYLQPWCWSPAAHHILKPLKMQASDRFKQAPIAQWRAEQKKFYAREFALSILKPLTNNAKTPWSIEPNQLPRVCYHLEDITNALTQWRQIVLKAPWSSSGRGVQVLRHALFNTTTQQWAQSIFKQQGYLMAEPLLDKVVDFSFQFKLIGGRVTFLGISYFETNSNGLYLGNYVNRRPEIDSATASFLDKNTASLAQELTTILQNSPLPTAYEGYFGVDALCYKQTDKLKIQPCLEINLRYNMGTLALKLAEIIHKEASGIFRIYFDKKISFSTFMNSKEEKIKQQDQKIRSGIVPLTPLYSLSFGAYLALNR